MAFQGDGNFLRVHNWVADRDASIKIRADRMDAECDGFATGLSTCITKDGQTTITANIPFANFKITGLGTPTADADASTKKYVDQHVVSTKTGAYTVVAADARALILADVSGGAFTITLPASANVYAGWHITVGKKDSSANAVTVDGDAAETINGTATRTLTDQFQTETYVWDGSEWKVEAAGVVPADGAVTDAKLADAKLSLASGGTVAGTAQFDAPITTPPETLTSSTGVALSMTGKSWKRLVLDHNTTITVSGEVSGQSVELWIVQGSTGGTAAWSGVDKWVGGSAPTLSTTAGEIDIIILTADSDGTTVIGEHVGVAS